MALIIVLLLIVFTFPFGPYIFSIIAYFKDKSNDEQNDGSFKRGGLFLKYGKEIYSSITPIKIDPSKNTKPKEEIVSELAQFLTDELELQFGGKNYYDFGELNITDVKMPRDKRKFLKITFVTPRNTKLHTIIYIPTFGHQIIIHQMVFLRGKYYWYDALLFILFTPFSVWFWIKSWFSGEYNIISSLSSRLDKSSFDFLDLVTIFKSITVLSQTKLLQYAKENNLLTDEIENIIVQNISNSQNISINQSKGIKIGNVSASVK